MVCTHRHTKDPTFEEEIHAICLLYSYMYQIMGNEEYANAIEIFQANVKIYPNSSNVYDSLGEVYEKSGNLKLAAENYEIAVVKGRNAKSPNLPVYEVNLKRALSLLNGSTQ